MTHEFTITAVAPNGEEREKTIEGTRADAEAKVSELRGLGFDNVEIAEKASDGGVEVVEDEPVPGLTECVHCGQEIEDGLCPDCDGEKETNGSIPDNPSVADDPIDWVPSHFVDEIQGVPAINRKGYAVLAEQYNIQVTREFVTYPSETDFTYAEAEATATTEDGREYCGFGSAHVDRDDDPNLLGELAETRAQKRALAMATEVGMTAVSELKNEL